MLITIDQMEKQKEKGRNEEELERKQRYKKRNDCHTKYHLHKECQQTDDSVDQSRTATDQHEAASQSHLSSRNQAART